MIRPFLDLLLPRARRDMIQRFKDLFLPRAGLPVLAPGVTRGAGAGDPWRNSNRERDADKRNALLVVAGLIASATYQSVLQPPKFKTNVDNTYTKGFLAGYASWMTGPYGRELAYIVFMSGNTFGLLVSVRMIISLTRDRLVLLSMALMVQSYYCHTYYLPFQSLEKEFSLKNAVLLSVLPLTIPILLLCFQEQLGEVLEFYEKKFFPR